MFSFVRKKNRHITFWVSYTVLFVMTSVLVFAIFIANGRSFVWASDAEGQYIPNLHYLYQNMVQLSSDAFPSFSFSTGLGGDVTSLYFKGVLDYLGVLLGEDNFEIITCLIILLRIYFSGISFSLLSFYWGNSVRSTLPGALIYAFSGFSLYYGMRHMSMIIPLILLPLLLVGIEKILRNENKIFFLIFVFYSAWCDYYFLYMNTLILGIYVCVRWIEQRRKWKEIAMDFLRIAMCYCAGIAVAAVSLLPRIYKLFAGERLSTITLESGSLFTYGRNWILQFVTRLISPFTTSRYSKYYMLYAVCSLVVPAVICLFMSREKKYLKLRIWFIVGSVFLCIPIFAFIFSGFNSLVNRWSYAYVLLLAMIVTVMLPKLELLDRRIPVICTATALFFFIALAVNSDLRDASVFVGICTLLLETGMLIFASSRRKKYKDSLIFYETIILAVLVNIGINGFWIYSRAGGNFSSQFITKGDLNADYQKSFYMNAKEIENKGFSRIEISQQVQSRANLPRMLDVFGTSIYDSTLPDYFIEINDLLLNRGLVTTNNFYGFDNRAILSTLGGVEYFITDTTNESAIPYGFDVYKEIIQDDSSIRYIYINEYMLPIGYTYDSYILESALTDSTALQLQNQMLKSAIIEYEDASLNVSKKVAVVAESDVEELPVKIECPGAVKKSESEYIVDEDGADIEITFENIPNAEVYLSIEGLDIDQVSEASFGMNIWQGGLNKRIWCFHSSDKYRTKHYQDHLINFGVSSAETERTCTVNLPYAGVYHIGNLKVYAVDLSGFAESVEKLKKESLTNIRIEKDLVSGNIQVSDTKVLCMSIPYSEFWHAYVDGKEVNTSRVNYLWMGIPLEKGMHEITFVYQNRALSIGAAISCCSVLLILCVLGISYIKKILKRRSQMKDAGVDNA